MLPAEPVAKGDVPSARVAAKILGAMLALMAAGVPVPAADAGCLQRLTDLPAEEQVRCADSGAFAAASVADIAAGLRLVDGTTDHRVVAALLDRLRRQGRAAWPQADMIAGLLRHQHPLYQGRDKWEVLRLRAYAFATLSDIDVPDSALPLLIETLVYVDERMKPVEVGAAVRAAGTLGARGREIVPYLLATIGERFAEEEFSLERYETTYPHAEATTVQLEAVRALPAMVGDRDDEALIVLRAIAASSPGSLDSRLVAGAHDALQAIDERRVALADAPRAAGGGDRAKIDTLTPWLEPADRQRLQGLDVTLEDHDGVERPLGQLIDRPVLVTFFYTRCQNAGKCSTAVSRLAGLQRELVDQELTDHVRLLALSFEPEFDTPVRLRRFALDRGLQLGSDAVGGRLLEEGHRAFLAELDTGVSYNGGWVSTHGVESVLLDGEGRLVRKYTTLGWDTARVLRDFRRLLSGG